MLLLMLLLCNIRQQRRKTMKFNARSTTPITVVTWTATRPERSTPRGRHALVWTRAFVHRSSADTAAAAFYYANRKRCPPCRRPLVPATAAPTFQTTIGVASAGSLSKKSRCLPRSSPGCRATTLIQSWMLTFSKQFNLSAGITVGVLSTFSSLSSSFSLLPFFRRSTEYANFLITVKFWHWDVYTWR